MDKSSCVRSAFMAVSLLMAGAASADVRLNKLDGCSDIDKLFKTLRDEGRRGLGSCRGPSGPVDRALVDRITGNAENFCFYDINDVTIAEGMSCVAMVGPGAPEHELLCYRDAGLDELAEFQENYESKYAQAESEYLDAAAACPIAAADATSIEPQQFPSVLTFIAALEFGYGSLLAVDGVVEGLAMHGFAAIEPALRDPLPGALEFLDVYLGTLAELDADALPVNDWLVDFDDVSASEDVFAEGLRAQGIPIDIRSLNFSLFSDTRPAATNAEKQSTTDRLQTALEADLATLGFSEFAIDSAAMIQNIESSVVPNRDAVRPRIETVRAYRYTGGEMDCTEDGEIVAQLISFKPVDNVRRDYGSMTMAFYGIGQCGDDIVTSIELDDFVELLNDTVITTLEEE